MILTVKERILLTNLFPADGKKISYQRAVRDIRDKAGLTAEELQEYSVVEKEGGTIEWDLEKPQEKEIEFTNAEIILIATELKEQDDADPPRLTANHVTLFEKFVEG